MPTTFSERLDLALSQAQKTRSELAKALRSPKGGMGVSPSAIGQLLDGKSKAMSAENCLRAARFLSVDAFWLATGEGQMIARSGLMPVSTARGGVSPETTLAALAALLRAVPLDLRAAVGDLLGAWAKAGGGDGSEDRLPALLRLIEQTGEPSSKRFSTG